MRSANAPTIRTGVRAANVIWNSMKMNSGMTTPSEKVEAVDSIVTPERNILAVPPQKAEVPPPKAKE
ncbi:hypothetical protein D3C80_493330 [compost metagenome]